MADEQDKDEAASERRKAGKRIIETPDYTGPDRRKSPRRVIERPSEPRK